MLTQEQLRELVREAVRAELQGAAVNQNDLREWYDTAGAAKYLCMSTSTLRRRINRGEIQPDDPARPGGPGTHRFRRATLDAISVRRK
jgi:hypothetical protein